MAKHGTARGAVALVSWLLLRFCLWCHLWRRGYFCQPLKASAISNTASVAARLGGSATAFVATTLLVVSFTTDIMDPTV